jgi:hypothetical protein
MDRYQAITTCAVGLTVLGALVFDLLLTALTGDHTRKLVPLKANIGYKGRYLALLTANVILGMAFAVIYALANLTPVDVIYGGAAFWHEGWNASGWEMFLDWGVAFVTTCIGISPIVGAIAIFRIEGMRRRGKILFSR